jgi:uncharacterized protein YqeY
MSLRSQIQEDMKTAMKSGAKERLGVIRLILAAIKQREVDERIELDDAQVVATLNKMLKQRKESITQYSAAGREDLADIEKREVEVISSYLPVGLSAEEIKSFIDQALQETGASSIADLGRVMALLKARVQGRADLTQISAEVKKALNPG